MAQSNLYAQSYEKLASPIPKRSRLSLKENKQLSQEPSSYFESKQDPGSKCVTENKENVSDDICPIQDENASPNCSFLQQKQAVADSANSIDWIFPTGLPNCGNTCYINSILQVLRYTPNFLSCIHFILSSQKQMPSTSDGFEKETDFFMKLHMLYIAMKKQENISKNVEKDISVSLLRPVKSFLLSLREVSSTFEEGEQHDAHEFLLTILSTFSSFFRNISDKISSSDSVLDTAVCNQDLKRSKMRGKRRTKMKSPERVSISCKIAEKLNLGFEGKIQRCIKCLECEKRLERLELFTDLEVPLSDSFAYEDMVDVMECLNQRTVLYGENKYFCDDCCHLNEAQISSEVVILPLILLLHCSWLRQSSDNTESQKDCTRVLIPLTLKTSENTELFCCTQDANYALYAIVLHLGTSTEGGHYVTFVRDVSTLNSSDDRKPLNLNSNVELCCAAGEIMNFETAVNRWYLFDDETVTSVYVNESAEIFPYFEFLGITATPCLIFYYRL